MFTYTEIYNAVEFLYPNVTNIDLFLEKLTDEQVVLITTYLFEQGCHARAVLTESGTVM